ncbi:M48 family metallopeptidase [Candidatus Magnetaquicoccus inordinatus]|uniref:M48 family metallopeptidase n=1 Tax=Candidatus Magnetaquicoccus inordinatus TaxID=2496818 RepID=UPI00102C339E|nr:SprT family zinc-dependent metalloprotease [Candidatus Magnetaquicoccus inordinatus]
MAIESHQITVSGLDVEVVRKDIKNLHLGVYPPLGRVRVAVPLMVTDEAVRLAVIEKLPWIRRQQLKFQNQPRQSQREMVNAESHYYLGQRYRLRVIERPGVAMVAVNGVTYLDLFVRPGTTQEQRGEILSKWYRVQLKLLILPLLEKWQSVLAVQVAAWVVKKMKTKWGSCNPSSRRILFNLELVKKPEQCLEYIVVHELAHLVHRTHGEEFIALLDTHLPHWRMTRELLNSMPLGHDEWGPVQ